MYIHQPANDFVRFYVFISELTRFHISRDVTLNHRVCELRRFGLIFFPVSSRVGTAVAQWLRCCATNRLVVGSIPAGFIGIFY